MTRTSTEISAAVQEPAIAHVIFCDLDFVSGHVRACSTSRAYAFGGNTYAGVGKLAGIGEVKEDVTLRPNSLELRLSGIDPALIVTTLAEDYGGRSVVLYVGYLDERAELVSDPYQLWEGRMDVMMIYRGEKTASIALVCESRLALFDKSSGWLYTTEHQQYLMGADDNFFDQTNTTDKALRWVDKSITFGGTSVPLNR